MIFHDIKMNFLRRDYTVAKGHRTCEKYDEKYIDFDGIKRYHYYA